MNEYPPTPPGPDQIEAFPTVAEEVCDSLTYRPGWRFIPRFQAVEIVWVGPNSHPYSDADDLELRVTVPIAGLPVSEAVFAIRDKLEQIDMHERSEWLRWDGQCVSLEARRSHPGGHFDTVEWAE